MGDCPAGQFKQADDCLPCDDSCLTCTGSADNCVIACENYERREDGECVNYCEEANSFINLGTEECETCDDYDGSYAPESCTLDSEETYCLYNPN
jgi:hypothetical protein